MKSKKKLLSNKDLKRIFRPVGKGKFANEISADARAEAEPVHQPLMKEGNYMVRYRRWTLS